MDYDNTQRTVRRGLICLWMIVVYIATYDICKYHLSPQTLKTNVNQNLVHFTHIFFFFFF